MKKTYHAAGREAVAVGTRLRCLLVIAVLSFSCFGMKATAQQSALPHVSVELQNTAIVNVFQSIQQQTDFSFVYNTSDINPAQTISVSANNAPLSSVLDKIFAGSGVSYTIKDKHIVLSKKASNPVAQTAGGGNFRLCKG